MSVNRPPPGPATDADRTAGARNLARPGTGLEQEATAHETAAPKFRAPGHDSAPLDRERIVDEGAREATSSAQVGKPS